MSVRQQDPRPCLPHSPRQYFRAGGRTGSGGARRGWVECRDREARRVEEQALRQIQSQRWCLLGQRPGRLPCDTLSHSPTGPHRRWVGAEFGSGGREWCVLALGSARSCVRRTSTVSDPLGSPVFATRAATVGLRTSGCFGPTVPGVTFLGTRPRRPPVASGGRRAGWRALGKKEGSPGMGPQLRVPQPLRQYNGPECEQLQARLDPLPLSLQWWGASVEAWRVEEV